MCIFFNLVGFILLFSVYIVRIIVINFAANSYNSDVVLVNFRACQPRDDGFVGIAYDACVARCMAAITSPSCRLVIS